MGLPIFVLELGRRVHKGYVESIGSLEDGVKLGVRAPLNECVPKWPGEWSGEISVCECRGGREVHSCQAVSRRIEEGDVTSGVDCDDATLHGRQNVVYILVGNDHLVVEVRVLHSDRRLARQC